MLSAVPLEMIGFLTKFVDRLRRASSLLSSLLSLIVLIMGFLLGHRAPIFFVMLIEVYFPFVFSSFRN